MGSFTDKCQKQSGRNSVTFVCAEPPVECTSNSAGETKHCLNFLSIVNVGFVKSVFETVQTIFVQPGYKYVYRLDSSIDKNRGF